MPEPHRPDAAATSAALPPPLFPHDCAHCVRFATTGAGDWYVCDNNIQTNWRNVIFRSGPQGADYISCPILASTAEAGFLGAALALGLRLTDDEVRRLLGAMIRSRIFERAASTKTFHELIQSDQRSPDEVIAYTKRIELAVLERP